MQKDQKKGYRDPLSLLFRDQTQKTALQVQRSKLSSGTDAKDEASSSRRGNRTTQNQHHASRRSKAVVRFQSVERIPPALVATVDERATCFFFQNYGLEADETWTSSGFKYLSYMYSDQIVGQAMTDAVSSLGLAGLSNSMKDPRIMIRADLRYKAALKSVREELQDLDQAKSDRTMGTVMLLGLYETNTCAAIEDVGSWKKHMFGALSLLSLRHPDSFKSRVGQHLLMQLRTQLVTHCLQARTNVPQRVLDLSRALPEPSVHAKSGRDILFIVADFCQLRASMSGFRDYSDPGRVIPTLLSLDASLVAWVSALPPDYNFTLETISEPSPAVFCDYYHIYKNNRVAAIWNHYRIVRVLIQELLLDQLLYVSQQDQAQYDVDTEILPFSQLPSQIFTSKSVLQQLMHDICASVPSSLGYAQPGTNGSHPTTTTSTSTPSVRAISGNLLIWPLFSTAYISYASPMMRSWIIGRLQEIAALLGVQQAAQFAQILLACKETDLLGPDRLIQ
ncbi:MAG: hypothetical protein M1818_004052 [Claussenomyces sp. TS43310]|nr:MAG: hypothetical protein M1818_004052 [Claussenomyces sp. TS43310]